MYKYICLYECVLVIHKMEETFIHASYLNLEDIMEQKQTSQTWTNTTLFYLHKILMEVKFIEPENEMMASRGWCEGRMESYPLIGT